MFTRMESDSVVTADGVTDAEVMAAVDEGPVEEFVLADVSRDEAYVTVALADAASLPAWR
jgi:hypothetical protein